MNMNWYVTDNRDTAVALAEIPLLYYAEFYEAASASLSGPASHCANYFGVRTESEIRFFFVLLDDSTGKVLLTSWKYGYYNDDALPSLTAEFPAIHVFEREITENFGIKFCGSLYDKPIRFSHDRVNRRQTMANYPFYAMDSTALHEVNVGPIHAGIIEPGAFRFICHGEEIIHMEIVLGYQHRGIEKLIAATDNSLRQIVLAESIAGDTAVSHAWNFCRMIENGVGFSDEALDRERTIAQEMERMAMHIADTGALCMDIGYQLGQVGCEALRTLVINALLRWCGNRFGKGLVRTFGSRYPLSGPVAEDLCTMVREVKRRYGEICRDMMNTSSVLSRFEECGPVSRAQMIAVGGVGMAARASGLRRDVRSDHPYGFYGEKLLHEPVCAESGDVMARLSIRQREVLQSGDAILALLRDYREVTGPRPEFHMRLPAETFFFSLTEGWRGEICHAAVSDRTGKLAACKIKDPSLHNWYALSLAVRGAGISDFPICNKSFNLSYCGHDL